jgi:hypothetical protein
MTHFTHIAHRVRRIWGELAYAQKRTLELRTGLDLGARGDSGLPRAA